MASTRLHPGFRFHPTDVELIMYYLKRKVMGKRFSFDAISEINIYKYSPWDLPDKSALKSRDREWFFFCPRERKYNSGGRMNRATENGYWKTTGKDRPVNYNDRVVGMIKTLVFHQGHPPKGQRTDWVIHEYRMEDQQLGDAGVTQDAFVLCKVYHKNGPGPRNGAQYGAPFEEEEWDNELSDHLDHLSSIPSVPCSFTHPLAIAGSSVLTRRDGPEVSSVEPFADPGPSLVPPLGEDIPALADDDILYLLSFTGDASHTVKDDNSREKLDHNIKENNIGSVAGLEGNDIYNGLPDLFNWQAMGGQGLCSFSDTMQFLELADLDIPLNKCLLKTMADLDSSIDNLEQMPTQNYNSNGDPQSYYGSSSFTSSLYPLSSAQTPFMAAAPDGVEDVSSIRQVNYDGTTLNDDGTAANEGDLVFWDRFNNMG